MKKLKEELKYGKKGITLISLVVTIIVLLILAGVSINLVLGPNGLISRAQEAALKTGEAEEIEALYMAVADSQIKNLTTQDDRKKNLEESIRAQFGDDVNFSVTDNGDGSFLVNMNDTKRMYYIDETGKVIDQSKMLKISTANELKSFRDDVNSGNAYEGWYVYLANDITLNINEEWEPIGLYPMSNSSPEDETNKPFKGVFDGNRHEVNGVYINTSNKVQGLFGLVNRGKVLNIGIGENCNINGGTATAGLVGYLYNNSQIMNSYNKATINASTNSLVGEIAGQTMNNCLIKNSYNEGIVNANSHVGGITGNLDNESIIDSCYNTGNITGRTTGDSATGGISGDVQNNSRISNCYNIGIITGDEWTGGIVGFFRSTGMKSENCYYLEGTVHGTNDTEIKGGVISVGSDELKSLASILGTAFKEAPEGTNDGYPILQWQ